MRNYSVLSPEKGPGSAAAPCGDGSAEHDMRPDSLRDALPGRRLSVRAAAAAALAALAVAAWQLQNTSVRAQAGRERDAVILAGHSSKNKTKTATVKEEPEPEDWELEREAEASEQRAIRIKEWLEIEKSALEAKVAERHNQGTAAEEHMLGVLESTTPPETHPCLGFEDNSCPTYPMPYGPDELPEKYTLSGGFPEGFIWGLGTASYQVEGGYREGGRGASIWDTFTGADTVGMPGAACSHCCKKAPCPVNEGMFDKGATGNVACDHYHLWRADVALMKSMGLQHYRFSIAWPRIYPTGRAKDGINREGIEFYNGLINELVTAGITPYVTLYHWDLPQGLLDPPKRNAWWARDPKTLEPVEEIVDEWLAFVDTCFRIFGDRVKVWVTFNEAWTFTWLASGFGKAPGLEEFSNISLDPYIAAHNVLLAHAKAVALYRSKYQASQGGQIGITNNCDWREPLTDSDADVAAAERGLLFQLGWLTDPIFGGQGDYPAVMKRMYRQRLPRFTPEEKKLLNGSADFLGLNHYGSGFSKYTPGSPGLDYSYSDMTEDGLQQAQSPWLYSAPWGFRKLLNWVGRRYPNTPIIVTEGGWSMEANNADVGARDNDRMWYYANYTAEMRAAIYEDGVDVRGYFAWALTDNFEWERGYAERFGVAYNEFAFGLDKNSSTNIKSQPTSGRQVRVRKHSSCWLEALWRGNAVVDPASEQYEGCSAPDVFNGRYQDPASPGCMREIVVKNVSHTVPRKTQKSKSHKAKETEKEVTKWTLSVQISGRDGRAGDDCNGVDDVQWGPLNATLYANTLIANFSSRSGGEHVMGFWNGQDMAVHWSDGTSWRWDPGA